MTVDTTDSHSGRRGGAQSLIEEIGKAGIPALVSTRGGKTPGILKTEDTPFAVQGAARMAKRV